MELVTIEQKLMLIYLQELKMTIVEFLKRNKIGLITLMKYLETMIFTLMTHITLMFLQGLQLEKVLTTV